MARIPKNVGLLIIWFHPTLEQISNTLLSATHFQKTWVVDNSPSRNWPRQGEGKEIEYIHQPLNIGIADALNIGFSLATDARLDFVLTLDQDTYIDGFIMNRHVSDSLELLKQLDIAVIGCRYELTKSCEGGHIHAIFENRDSVITSGSIIRLTAWVSVCGFDSKLFIDQVDHDFCYRLKELNQKIFINTAIKIRHTVGDPITVKFFNKTLTTTNHTSTRRYYQIRNSLYIRKRFPQFSKPLLVYLKELAIMFICIIAAENGKIKKLLAIAYGVIDHLRSRYGKCNLKFLV